MDIDPGVGNGTALAVNTNTGMLDQTFTIPTAGLSSGFHRVYLRVLDDDGDWSLYDSVTYYINALDNTNTGGASIVAAEYFFDTEPGVGNGTTIAVNVANPLEDTFAIPTTGLDAGFHRVYIRVQDDDGDWSLYDSASFYINALDNTNTGGTSIVAAEYFFDIDPGFGQAIPAPIVSTGNQNEFSFIIDGTTFDCTEPHTFYLRVLDDEGTWSLYDFRDDFTDGDTVPPDVDITTEISLPLDQDGVATLDLAAINNATTDDCSGIASLVLSETSFTCDDIGTVQVTFTATDNAGNSIDEVINVTIVDTSTPLLVVQDMNLSLDTNGSVVLDPNQLVNSLEDNCSGSLVVNASQTDFSCNDIGVNTVLITVTDAAGNTAQESALLTIIDDLAPSISTQNQTIMIDENGMAVVVLADLIITSNDNCSGSLIFGASQTDFTCDDLGMNTVMVSATDGAGNTTETVAIITIIDDLAPSLTTQDQTIVLDENGMANVMLADLIATSSDNCSDSLVFSASQTDFTCNDLGANTVLVTTTDGAGNIIEVAAVVTVIDDLAPSLITQDMTLALDENGLVVLDPLDFVVSSTDNCLDSLVLSVNQLNFTCDDLGSNAIIISATDGAGNITEEGAIVTIIDNLGPSLVTQDQTIVLDENGAAFVVVVDVVASSTDNCSEADSLVFNVNQTDFTCDDLGTNTIVVSAADSIGNITEEDVVITVVDATNPIVLDCPLENIQETVGTGESFEIPDYTGLLDVSDNCGVQSISQEPTVGTSLAIGTTSQDVTIEVIDTSGNITTCIFSIAIEEVLSTTGFSFDDEVVVFPIPAKEFVNIQSSRRITKTVLIDVKGSIISISEGQEITQVSTSLLASGTYFLRLFSDDEVTTKKIVKSSN